MPLGFAVSGPRDCHGQRFAIPRKLTGLAPSGQTIVRNNLTVRSILRISGLSKGGINYSAEKLHVFCSYSRSRSNYR
jgi:hypothetical protein